MENPSESIFINRELSWLDFDSRVLALAKEKSVPLAERIKFAAIFGSNMDEFFMVRVGSLYDQTLLKNNKLDIVTHMTASEQIAAITPRVQELRVINTICAATSERQQAAASLANRCDCMVVVGGKNSGNTRRLAQICADACERTHHIEDASELEAEWFANAQHIGITAGASTPQEHIERAVARIKELCR